MGRVEVGEEGGRLNRLGSWRWPIFFGGRVVHSVGAEYSPNVRRGTCEWCRFQAKFRESFSGRIWKSSEFSKYFWKIQRTTARNNFEKLVRKIVSEKASRTFMDFLLNLNFKF